MTLGDVIKAYRNRHGMSMDAFAKASGLSKAYVGILEKNVNPTTGRPAVPSIVTYKAASLAMGMDMQDLIEMVDDDSPVSLETVDSLDWDLSQKELECDMNRKIQHVQQELTEISEPLSHLPDETVDKLIGQFRELVNLYHDALERETTEEG